MLPIVDTSTSGENASGVRSFIPIEKSACLEEQENTSAVLPSVRMVSDDTVEVSSRCYKV